MFGRYKIKSVEDQIVDLKEKVEGQTHLIKILLERIESLEEKSVIKYHQMPIALSAFAPIPKPKELTFKKFVRLLEKYLMIRFETTDPAKEEFEIKDF